MKWQGRSIYAGIAQGQALVTHMGISFFGGVDPDTGMVVERGHELEGQSIAGKILVFPTGKGSTVGSYTLYRLAFNGKTPAAIINHECEPITAVGCIIAEIPCVDHLPLNTFKTGQYLQVDASRAVVEELPWPGDTFGSLATPLTGQDPNSFAYYTITQRFINMLRQVVADYPWTDEIFASLHNLQEQIPHGQLGLLQDGGAPDEQAWNHALRFYQHLSWLEAPWLLVETYFFRRILAATGYFQEGPGREVDPYAAQKRQALDQVSDGLSAFYQMAGEQAYIGDNAAARLSDLLRLSLWGNQADLSMWSTDDQNRPDNPQAETREAHILDDDSLQASRYLLSLAKRSARVDFVLDNGGIELAYDLALADLLIKNNLAAQVILHVKPHPTYVSDVIRQDVFNLLEYLSEAPSSEVQALANRFDDYLAQGQVTLNTHFYWTSPLSGWEMPPDLRQDLRKSNLIISKGDANYRRWLGDRSWSFTTPVHSVLNYLPAPFLAFRVLKSNVLLGLPDGVSQALDKKDPQWLTNGAWGVIQAVGI